MYFQDKAFIKMGSDRYETLAHVKDTWEKTFTSSVYDQHFLDDSIEKEYVLERMVFNGFTIFSILAISIGCLGLFGLMTFIVSRKTKEISIRKVLGANLLQTFSFVTKEFMVLVVLAFVIAAPFVYYYANLLA